MKMCYHIHVGKFKNVAGVMYRFGCADFGVGCLFCLEVFLWHFVHIAARRSVIMTNSVRSAARHSVTLAVRKGHMITEKIREINLSILRAVV